MVASTEQHIAVFEVFEMHSLDLVVVLVLFELFAFVVLAETE